MRKTEIVEVPAWGGRDKGKLFRITEWPGLKAEEWGWRVFLALKGSSGYAPLNLEDELANYGMVGVALRGVNAFLAASPDPRALLETMNELFECVQRVRDPKHPDVATAIAWEIDDVEEPKTVAWLRSEVLRLHTGFSLAEALFKLASAINRRASESTPTSPLSRE